MLDRTTRARRVLLGLVLCCGALGAPPARADDLGVLGEALALMAAYGVSLLALAMGVAALFAGRRSAPSRRWKGPLAIATTTISALGLLLALTVLIAVFGSVTRGGPLDAAIGTLAAGLPLLLCSLGLLGGQRLWRRVRQAPRP
jgi:hypothetical protein